MSIDETLLLPPVVVAVLKESGYDKYTATWTLGGDGQGRTMLTLKWLGNSSVSNLGTEMRAITVPATTTTKNTGIQTDVKEGVTIATQTPKEWVVIASANVKTEPASKVPHSEKHISLKKTDIKREQRESNVSNKRTQNDSFIESGPTKVSKLDGRFPPKPSLSTDDSPRLHRNDKMRHPETRPNSARGPSIPNDRYMVQSNVGMHPERRNSYPENMHRGNGPMHAFKKRIVCEENLITYNNKILTHAEIPGVPESKSIIYLKLHDQYGAAPKVANSHRATEFYNELYTGFKYGPDAMEYKRLLPLLIDHANSYLLRLASEMGVDALPCPVPYLDLETSEKTGLYVDIKL